MPLWLVRLHNLSDSLIPSGPGVRDLTVLGKTVQSLNMHSQQNLT